MMEPSAISDRDNHVPVGESTLPRPNLQKLGLRGLGFRGLGFRGLGFRV